MEKFMEIQIPDGYEIDESKSTFTKIIFKRKHEVKVWYDLYDKVIIPDTSCYITSGSDIKDMGNPLKFRIYDKNVFIDEKHARSALAMAQISQLMPYYGGAITDKEWANGSIEKYTIERFNGVVDYDIHNCIYFLLAFHTEEQRQAFSDNNIKLIKDYLMIE